MRFRKLVAICAVVAWEDSQDEDLTHAVKLSVITKCPEKYLLVDTETGQVYKGSNEDNPFMPTYKLWKAVEK
jgi:hypothetical protein